eukprot:TRINITY_DN3071_c0_g1_i3.p1 TRINITY_DN3071_c0_g1~~TRINITY_DN3071_c0_g1_i3.p1  ORF type:complete len:223 (+),score=63.12 TRINITY_DN3071_c0_g1_i3:353-1021(+)
MMAGEIQARYQFLDNDSERVFVPPQQVLMSGYEKVTDEMIKGSTTVCIVSLNGETRELVCENLGDSGMVLLRGKEVITETEAQQHAFNTPYQLSCQIYSGDTPKHVDRYVTQVQEGDIVVTGTDGLFDSLYVNEIIEIVSTCFSRANSINKFDPSLAAQRLAYEAHELARDPKKDKDSRVSPFEVACVQAGYSSWKGGKLDDITVVVSLVVKADNETDSLVV